MNRAKAVLGLIMLILVIGGIIGIAAGLAQMAGPR
jgi:hypothetical protein